MSETKQEESHVEKLTNFWKSIVGEDADHKKVKRLYIIMAVAVVVFMLFVL